MCEFKSNWRLNSNLIDVWIQILLLGQFDGTQNYVGRICAWRCRNEDDKKTQGFCALVSTCPNAKGKLRVYLSKSQQPQKSR